MGWTHPPEEDYAPFEVASPQLAERMANVARGVLAMLAPDGGAEADAVPLVVSDRAADSLFYVVGGRDFDGLRSDQQAG